MIPVFETKKGTILYWTGALFYTTDEDDIYQSLEKDLLSDDPIEVAMAEDLVQQLSEYGCVEEV